MSRLISAAGALLNAADAASKSLNKLDIVEKSKSAVQEWTAVDEYPYEPLPTPTSIRLLKLLPSRAMQKEAKAGKPLTHNATDDDDDIHFSMQTVELKRNPRFTALSYTWRQQRSSVGTWTKWGCQSLVNIIKDKPVEYELPDPDEKLKASLEVTCNGYTMYVFENLYEALKQLRRTRPGDWLWIDAICMNQRDSVELLAQLQIMGRIYQSAQLVVVWLGTFPRLAEKGLKTLTELAHSGAPLPRNPIYASEVGDSASEDWKMGSAALTAYHLVHRSWFKRVWVVQELCLAHEVLYLHGRHELSYETLLTSCLWCVDSNTGREKVESELQTLLAPYHIAHMRFLPTTLEARKEFAKGHQWTLLQWFQACNGRQASVGKDYVFAGLSLVRSDCLSIDQSLQPITPAPPPLPRRPVGGKDMSASTVDKCSSIVSASLAPSTVQSLTPTGLWPKLMPKYSPSDAEVFVNAAACLLTHALLEDVLRIASRLRDKHRFRSYMGLRPRDLEAFSELPSWVPAIGSWTSRLTIDLVLPGVESPFAACPVIPNADPAASGTPLPIIGRRVSISPDGKILTLAGAVVDKIATIQYSRDLPLQFKELRKLMRFLTNSSSIYDENQKSILHPGHDQKCLTANADGSCIHRPSLLEDVSCAMVAGHVVGQKVTPAQTGPWLCEMIESKALHHIAEKQRALTDDQQTLQALEAAAQKRGQGTNHLETAEDDTHAEKWRACNESVKTNTEIVAETTAELAALKASYPQLSWPTESISIVPTSQDLARIQLERRTSKEKELEELRERRSVDSKSSSKIRDALDRGKASVTELVDRVHDRLTLWEMNDAGRFIRKTSQACRAYEEASIEVLNWRRICLTEKGHVLLGPLWLEEGDSVVLMPGVSVPFIFAPQKDDLEREAVRIKERLTHVDTGDEEDLMWSAAAKQLEARLVEVEYRLKQVAEQPGERWVLIGDAYVQGIMQGEAAVGLEFGTIDVA